MFYIPPTSFYFNGHWYNKNTTISHRPEAWLEKVGRFVYGIIIYMNFRDHDPPHYLMCDWKKARAKKSLDSINPLA